MQRLFSTFPNGWPGCGLLLLRLSCGVQPLLVGSTRLWGAQFDAAFAVELLSCITALSILVGFWTPVGASIQTVLQAALACFGETFVWAHLTLAINDISLVMLGPGSSSMDARLYGRKRIDLGRSQRTP